MKDKDRRMQLNYIKFLWFRLSVSIILLLIVFIIAGMLINSHDVSIFKNKLTTQDSDELFGLSLSTNAIEFEPRYIVTDITVDKKRYNMVFAMDLLGNTSVNYETDVGYTYFAYESDSKLTEIIIIDRNTGSINLLLDMGLELSDFEYKALQHKNRVFRTVTALDYGVIEKSGINYYNSYYLIVMQTTHQTIQDMDKLETLITLDKVEQYDETLGINYRETNAIRLLNVILDCALYKEYSEFASNLELDSLNPVDLYAVQSNLLEDNQEQKITYQFESLVGLYITGLINVESPDVLITDLSLIPQYESIEFIQDGNLYMSADYDNKTSSGYRVFGLQTPKGLYCVQLNPNLTNEQASKLKDALVTIFMGE